MYVLAVCVITGFYSSYRFGKKKCKWEEMTSDKRCPKQQVSY